jgi:site-specific recombinase XerD
MSDTLEPIDPEGAFTLYLRDRENKLADATIDSYRYRLKRFVEWCRENELDNLNNLSGRYLLRFKQYRAEDLNSVSLKRQLNALRIFIRWCESMDAVEQGLHYKVLSPPLNDGDRERDVLFDSETADDMLDHLAHFSYASFPTPC